MPESIGPTKLDATHVYRGLMARDIQGWYRPIQDHIAEILGDRFMPKKTTGVSLVHVRDFNRRGKAKPGDYTNGFIQREIRNRLPSGHDRVTKAAVRWATTLRAPDKTHIAASIASEQVESERDAVRGTLGQLGLMGYADKGHILHVTFGSVEGNPTLDRAVFQAINEEIPQDFLLRSVTINDRTAYNARLDRERSA